MNKDNLKQSDQAPVSGSLPLAKSVHQIYLEIKELNLSDDDFKKRLKEEGVIVSKQSLDKQHEIANRISKRITDNDR